MNHTPFFLAYPPHQCLVYQHAVEISDDRLKCLEKAYVAF
jgi:hypothetical protein